jgi:heptosyltransferase-2
MTAPSSPLHGRYLVRNPLLRSALRLIDRVYSALPRASIPVGPPRRVLVANIAHLGDVLYSTGVLPALREAFPGARIGFLAGSWSAVLLAGHPLIDRLHTFDHARLNRSSAGPLARLRRHLASRSRAVAEIRAAGYDAAIDLYPHFPNAVGLLRAAGVPVRVGYTSGGFGPLLTHPVDWPLRDWHVSDYHAHLLNHLPLPAPLAGPLPPALPRPWGSLPSGLPAGFLQVHPCSGNALKEWPLDNWRRLAQALVARGHRLVLTGGGPREQQACAALAGGLPGCVDCSGRLGWAEFVAVAAAARVVVGVDSIAGHLAAALGTPAVVVSTGITGDRLWAPLGPAVVRLSHPLPCAPCWRSRGCPGMSCVRNVGVQAVLDAVESLLAAPGQGARLVA